MIKNIAIFASGAGTNAKKIIGHFRGHPSINIALIVSNKPNAGIVDIAKAENIPLLLLDKEQFFNGDGYVQILKEREIQFIVLAGFLWKIPISLIQAYPRQIINIHPALLPQYGGKGMYGQYVHQAVIGNKESKSGITIHYVDEVYDHGDIIFQATCPVLEGDNTASLAQRVAALEHAHYPGVIQELVERLQASSYKQ